MLNAKDAKKLTKENNIFIKVEKLAEPFVKEQAKRGYDYCEFKGIKELCPRGYSYGEWSEKVKNHFIKELGYEISIKSDNDTARLEW